MKLFGGILPFIGFVEEELDDDLRAFLHLPAHMETINTFELSWLNVAIKFPIRPAEDD